MEHLDSEQQVLSALGTASSELRGLESYVSALPEPHQGPIKEFLAAQDVQSSADLVCLQKANWLQPFNCGKMTFSNCRKQLFMATTKW